ncbi:hypothetical protein FRC03_000252 [Tulasnella sp. 419]|nr:hypothetical protein FRC03_000252 [Tulasnella sp. 419]
MSLSLRESKVAVRIFAKDLLTFDNLRNYVFFHVVVRYLLRTYRHLAARGLRRTTVELWRGLVKNVILAAMKLPHIRKQVDSQMAQARKDIENKLVPKGPSVIRHLVLPSEGRSLDWIMEEMERMDLQTGGPSGNDHYRTGKLSGAVYHGGKDLEDVIIAAMQRYIVSNPLHPDAFPTIRKMEAEIIAMCLRMFHNPTGAGSTTSGGTESIVMSCKTHRDWARDVKGITEPEMIIPASAHPAFDKGSHYLGIKIHHIPVHPITRKVDVRRLARAINRNTIMIVGSVINFPDGNMDDIVALAKLAKRYGVGLHVDCCLGSFIVPFLEEAGFPIAPFDFRVDGVTAISCDTHKYGFAPKGSSVIMYRDSELRKYQYYVYPDWAGGVYASPSLAGSRPGSLIAGAWATMQYMGYSGYLASCRSIVTCAKTIESAIRSDFPDLFILGDPVASVVAFGSQSPSINIMEVGDIMSTKGWHLNALNNPPALHIACTRLTTAMTEQFIADLQDAVRDARGKAAGKGTMVSLYGLGVSSPAGPNLVTRIATAFLDTLYIA